MTTFKDALALLREKAEMSGLSPALEAVSQESGVTVFALEYLTAHLEEAIAEAMEPDERAEPGTMPIVEDDGMEER